MRGNLFQSSCIFIVSCFQVSESKQMNEVFSFSYFCLNCNQEYFIDFY